MNILQALGENPAEIVVAAMDTDQLAKEMAYWDDMVMRPFKQGASPAAT
jgi:hypothetical protein